jgi:hypothetical protein
LLNRQGLRCLCAQNRHDAGDGPERHRLPVDAGRGPGHAGPDPAHRWRTAARGAFHLAGTCEFCCSDIEVGEKGGMCKVRES